MSRVEIAVLGLLAEEPLYGYQLLERFRERAMGLWAEVGRASVYQCLHRLERDGRLTGRDQGRGEGPERRTYRITRSGRELLRHGLRVGMSEATAQPEAAVAFGFAHLMSADELRRGIASRLAALERLDLAVRAERNRLAGERGPGNRMARRMLDLEGSRIRAERSWLATLRRDAGRLRR